MSAECEAAPAPPPAPSAPAAGGGSFAAAGAGGSFAAAAGAPAPAAPLPPVTTLHYQGPAPYPHPPVTDPTPEEQYQRYVTEQEEQQRAKDRELQAQQEAARGSESAGGAGGMMGKFSMFAKAVGHQMDKGAKQFHGSVEAKVRQETNERDKRKWLSNFPEQHQAQWICDYACKVMHAGQAFTGSIILSTTHLCWLSAAMKDAIPLTEIASVTRSVCLPTVHNGPPFILPIPAPHVIPNCLQVFTKRMQVFQFLEFTSHTATVGQHMTASLQGTPLERAYNFLDHAWRASVTVPLPDVDYQPPPQA